MNTLMKSAALTAAAAALFLTAGCTTPRTQTSTLPPGTVSMDPSVYQANQQAVDAAARAMQDEARAKEAARQAAQAEAARVKAAAEAKAAEAKARAQKAASQRAAAAAQAKAERQAKLDAYEDRVRELELQLKELDVEARRAEVEVLKAQGAKE